jgi:hypothetical protein
MGEIQPRVQPAAEPLTARPKGGSQATDSITFALALNYFLHFWPKNRMSSPKTT